MLAYLLERDEIRRAHHQLYEHAAHHHHHHVIISTITNIITDMSSQDESAVLARQEAVAECIHEGRLRDTGHQHATIVWHSILREMRIHVIETAS